MEWIGALVVGLSLGLLGSGGSILTVPVLIFVVGRPEKLAVAESLAIVGTIALVGALFRMRAGKVSGPAVLGFGLPGMVGAGLGAQLGVRLDDAVQLLVFSVVMLSAAVALLRPAALADERGAEEEVAIHYGFAALQGLAVGAVTGLVGVGGGFLIVPALVLFLRLPLPVALGTSLTVIALQSAVGFLRYGAELRHELDPVGIAAFASIGSLAALVGGRVADRIPQRAFQRGFAVLLLLGGLALFLYYVERLL